MNHTLSPIAFSTFFAAFLQVQDARAEDAKVSETTSREAPADPQSTSTSPAPSGQGSETPVVELSSDASSATIERRMGTTSSTAPYFDTGAFSAAHWEHTCIAPCQLRLDTRYQYRVAGDGLVPTEGFGLPRGPNRVRVDAKMGSSVGRVSGLVAAVGGAIAMTAGGLALAATPILDSEDVGSKGFRTGVLVSGVGALSVGAISVVAGLVLWLSNGSRAAVVGDAR